MSFRRSVTRDIAQPCNKESGSHVARQQRIKAVHKIPRIKRENGVHKLEAETISDLCTPIPSERRVTNWARHSGAEFRRQSIEGRTCVLSDFPFARIQGCRTADLGRAIEVNSPLSKLIGARVIVAPFVITRIFWQGTTPSAASHLPFSRILGTRHSCLSCGSPHSLYKLETVSIRIASFARRLSSSRTRAGHRLNQKQPQARATPAAIGAECAARPRRFIRCPKIFREKANRRPNLI